MFHDLVEDDLRAEDEDEGEYGAEDEKQKDYNWTNDAEGRLFIGWFVLLSLFVRLQSLAGYALLLELLQKTFVNVNVRKSTLL